MITHKGIKTNAGEARLDQQYKMKGITNNTVDTKISGSDTGGSFVVFEQIGESPKGGPPMHVHPSQDEWFYVLEGEYLFQVDDVRHQMKAGDTIFLPREVPHAFVQLSDKGKMLYSFSPAGKMESFFKATAAWTTPPTAEEVANLFLEHDMKVVGPPLKVD